MKPSFYIIVATIIILAAFFLTYKLTHDYTLAIGVATVSATILVPITLTTIKQRESLNREIKEKIYAVVHRQLEAFLQPASHTVRFDSNGRDLSISWDWDAIKNQEFHLAYRIPKDHFKRLEEFTEVLSRYKDSFTQCVKEILKEMSSRVEKIWSNEGEIFYVKISVGGKKGGLGFDIFQCLFLEKDIRKNLQEFRMKKDSDEELECEFLNRGWDPVYYTRNENEVVELFEELFQHIKEKSENYKNLVSFRESAKTLAHQILKLISPK